MKQVTLVGFFVLLSGCQAHAPARVPVASSPARAVRSELCAAIRISSQGPVCMGKLTPELQSHRDVSMRLEYEGERVARRFRINGRGSPEPDDDDDCVEHRYRYADGELVESTGYTLAGVVCERTLFSDHAQRELLVDEWGRQSLSRDRLFTEERSDRDVHGLVLRNRVFGPDGSAVSPYGGAHEVRYERDARGLETRMCLFDAHGAPIENGSRAHCYSYVHDEFGNEIERRSWNAKNEPAEDYGGTHRTAREVDAYGNVVSVHFFGRDGRPISTEDGHCSSFAFQFDQRGFRSGGECLDGQAQPSRFRDGNAYWRVSPDASGRVREGRYFDRHGNPVLHVQGFARYEIKRDALGRTIENRYFLADGSPGRKEGAAVIRYQFDAQGSEVRRTFFDGSDQPRPFRGCAELDSEYDSFRQLTRRSCKDASGKLTRASDGTMVKEWSYDARGLAIEERHLNENGQLAADEDGYARIAFHYDALGQEHGSRHFALDGREISVPRFNSLLVRAPHSDAFWPGFSREEALGRIEAARRAVLAGAPFDVALRAYGDSPVNATHPGDIGYHLAKNFYGSVRVVTANLQVGELSQITEFPYGFAFYQRTE